MFGQSDKGKTQSDHMSILFDSAIRLPSVYALISWHLLPQVRKYQYLQDKKHVIHYRACLDEHVIK